MSGFDDNPFGDPMVPKPAPGPTVQTGLLDSYNPFDDNNKAQSTGGAPQGYQKPPFQPAVLPTSTAGPAAPPAYSASAAQRITTEDLEKRQRELEARAAELQRREDEQRLREQQDVGKSGGRANNWPPLPSFFPCQPCFYQDIDLDIPVEFRQLVKWGYYVWIAHVVILFVNLIGTLVYFIGSEGSSTAGTTFGSSILFLLLLVPCSFLCWFRPLYKAFKFDSSFNFFLFFLVFALQCGIVIIQCLGINWFASCGWINGFSMIGAKTRGVGVFMIFIAIGFTALAVIDVLLLIKVHRIYRSTGASFEKAKQEFSAGVATNPVIRNSAAEFGASAARGAFAPQPGAAEAGNRY